MITFGSRLGLIMIGETLVLSWLFKLVQFLLTSYLSSLTDMDARGCTSAICIVHPVSSSISLVLFFIVNALW